MRSLGLLFALAACGDSRAMPDGHPGGGDADVDAAEVDAMPDAMIDAPVGCGTLGADPSDVFVDNASTKESAGTMACPFHAIKEALALAVPAATRTIHVAAGAYVEAAIVALPPSVTLEGAGEAMVTISGGGTCAVTASPCTVSVAGGATLRQVTVTNTTGDAIVVTGGVGNAAIDHATASNAKRFGITIRGTSVVLDHVTSKSNMQDGLNAKMGVVTITSSTFSNNSDSGLDIDQGATLVFNGGMLTGNFDAIFIHNTLAHEISNLSILQNLGYGIYCSSGSSCKVRGTTMFGNEVGLIFDVSINAVLDVGTAASPGGNKFAGPNVTEKNVRAGLCFQQSGATQAQLVEGNTWRGCPPPAKKIGPFCRSNNTYSDIAYVPAVSTSSSPVVPPAACTASP